MYTQDPIKDFQGMNIGDKTIIILLYIFIIGVLIILSCSIPVIGIPLSIGAVIYFYLALQMKGQNNNYSNMLIVLRLALLPMIFMSMFLYGIISWNVFHKRTFFSKSVCISNNPENSFQEILFGSYCKNNLNLDRIQKNR